MIGRPATSRAYCRPTLAIIPGAPDARTESREGVTSLGLDLPHPIMGVTSLYHRFAATPTEGGDKPGR